MDKAKIQKITKAQDTILGDLADFSTKNKMLTDKFTNELKHPWKKAKILEES